MGQPLGLTKDGESFDFLSHTPVLHGQHGNLYGFTLVNQFVHKLAREPP